MINNQTIYIAYLFQMSAFEVCVSRECWDNNPGQNDVLKTPHALSVNSNA